MAAHGWSSGRPLNFQIRESSGNFDFYQFVRLLEMESKRTGAEYRFKSDLNQAFPTFEIKSLRREAPNTAHTDGPDRFVAETSNYCIAGYSGPLPESYQNWVREKNDRGEMVIADFLNIFNDRINYLRFDARSSSIQALDNSDPASNILSRDIAGVMGMVSGGLFERLTEYVQPADTDFSAANARMQRQARQAKRSLMALAGLISSRRIGAHIIGRILRTCFRVPVKVRDLVGGWKNLASDQVCNLGVKASRLGELCLLGTSAWDMNRSIRVSIGPLPFTAFVGFLPAIEFRRKTLVSRTYALFREFSRFITNRSVDVEVELLVEQETIEPVRIFTPDRQAETVFRLGLSTWLGRPTQTGVCRYRIGAFGGDAPEVMETGL